MVLLRYVIRSAAYEDNEIFLGEDDTQPELYMPENRDNVEFDSFKGSEKSILALKILQNPEGKILSKTL